MKQLGVRSEPLFKLVAQARYCQSQPRFDRAQWQFRLAGDFRMRPALVKRKLDQFALFFRQLGQRTAHLVGLDPTNACVVRDDHIVVARGRDYGDVAPIDGLVASAGAQKLTVGVDVIPEDDAA